MRTIILEKGNTARQQFTASYILELKIDKPIEVVIKNYIPNRNNQQNKLWHKWIDIMAHELGYTVEEMKEAVKREILGTIEYKDLNGVNRERVKSSSELNRKDFSMLIDKTGIIAAQMGIILPMDER